MTFNLIYVVFFFCWAACWANLFCRRISGAGSLFRVLSAGKCARPISHLPRQPAHRASRRCLPGRVALEFSYRILRDLHLRTQYSLLIPSICIISGGDLHAFFMQVAERSMLLADRNSTAGRLRCFPHSPNSGGREGATIRLGVHVFSNRLRFGESATGSLGFVWGNSGLGPVVLSL